jgi:hypothetical protein
MGVCFMRIYTYIYYLFRRAFPYQTTATIFGACTLLYHITIVGYITIQLLYIYIYIIEYI